MGEIVLGILLGIAGLVVLFTGYRFARILLPIWGFVTGFVMGLSFVADATSSTFLGTVFGFVVGIFLGLLFAALIYAYYYAAIVILGATTGYWLGASFIGLFGIDPGFLTALAGVALGVVFALLAIALNIPKVFLIVFTAYGGAVVIVTALMLIFDVIPNAQISYEAVRVAISNSFFWWVFAVVLGTIGMGTQLTMERELEIQQWNMLQDGKS